jgi:hypothetical protein
VNVSKIERIAQVLRHLPEHEQENLKFHLTQQTPIGVPDNIDTLHATGGA